MKLTCFSDLRRLVVVASLAVVSTSTPAVMRSVDGVGQVAIVPIFNTIDGMDTLLKVDARYLSTGIENRDIGAVRIQFRSPQGDALEAFNVYLDGAESWIAAITAGVDGPELVIPDESCILGEDASGAPVLVETGAPLSAAYGYAEVLEMGEIPLADSALVNAIRAGECDALIEEFQTGAWSADPNAGITAPPGRLRVSASLIDVQRGTLYSTDPVHLHGFRDAPFHAGPSAVYGLADARDSGTATGATRSTICTDACVVEEWSEPSDAVAAALVATSMDADFVVNPLSRASSVAVLLSPMQPYYPEGHPSQDSRFALWVRGTDPLGLAVPCIITPPPGTTCPYLPFGGPDVLDAISIDVLPTAEPVPDTVPILGIPGGHPIRQAWLEDNTFPTRSELDSGAIWVFGQGSQWLTSNDGTRYLGQPNLMLMLVELVNGQLFDDDGQSIRSNYGASSVGSRAVRSLEADE